MGTRERLGGLVALVVALLVAGCSFVPDDKGAIEFADIFEGRREDELLVERTVELDADGDTEAEWVVLYRYDRFQQRDWANTPIQGIVYDAVPCDPPMIQTWRLPFPDNDFLGEGERINVFLDDWLGSNTPGDATNELIIDGPGPVNTLSIYRFRDPIQNPCVPPDPARQGFQLLGFFRANGEIEWDEETRTVTTRQRSTFERSQLAIRSVYFPRQTAAGETFLGDDGRLKAPDEQSVDFLFDTPASPLDSPYPEKAVAAFYLTLGVDNERAQRFLTEPLQDEFFQRVWGLDVTPDQISRALIYSISYTPDREAELARRTREVTVVVAAVDQNNQRLPPRRVTWRVVGIPIPNEQDCEWRLEMITEVVITPGLGMVPKVPDVAVAQ